jgi:hypothetical protein
LDAKPFETRRQGIDPMMERFVADDSAFVDQRRTASVAVLNAEGSFTPTSSTKFQLASVLRSPSF